MADPKPKKELTEDEAIDEAIEEVRLAMKENYMADRDETAAKLRKRAAHNRLQIANRQLTSLQKDLYTINFN